jgi:YVTN family beta-propeller protein
VARGDRCANSGSASVTPIDTATNAAGPAIPAQPNPYAIAIANVP